MKRLIKSKNFLIKLILTAIVIFVLIFTPIIAFNRAKNYEIYSKPQIDSKIYTVWHIETFEGGKQARINYLKSVARKIESEYAGVYIMIKSIDPSELDSALQTSSPDIISFGYGVGMNILNKLIPFNKTYDIRDELLFSSLFNDKLYALPYMLSGYAIFKHSALSEEFHCGYTSYTRPENIYNNLSLSPKENETQYEAYKDFVYNENVVLLGTARDLFRIDNLNKVGRANASISPIDTYTDLVQYLGKLKDDEITNKFCSLALSDTYQTTLTEFGLFTTKYNKLYSDGIYKDMENALFNCEIARVFVS